jgi:glycosyltransferase involved in cell wall biosynthesis
MEKLINQSQAGYVISDTSPRNLAAGIQSIITNPDLPRADEIRKFVLKYSWSNVATAILNEYETAIEHRSLADECPLLARASCG